VAINGTIETTWIHAAFNARMVSRCRQPMRDLLDMYQSQVTLSGRDFTSPELTFDVNQIFHSTVAWGLGSLFLEICDVLPANTFWQEQYGANNVGHGSPTELNVVVVDFVFGGPLCFIWLCTCVQFFTAQGILDRVAENLLKIPSCVVCVWYQTSR
jgi:hypothetical protein